MTPDRYQPIRSAWALLWAVLRWIGIGAGAWLIVGIAEASRSSPDVCSRTVQVRDATLAASRAADCGQVTTSDLREIANLHLYDRTQAGGPAVTLATRSKTTRTFPAPTELTGGTTLRFTLKVTDAERFDANDGVEVTVAASVQPLTARVEGLPERHDGGDSFRFRLYFSEEIRISYRTLPDTAFVVHGGSITGVRRLAPPSNVGWRITVRPASNAAVVLVLPADLPCGDLGAVCTADGKRLSNRLEITVPGPE